MKVSKKILISIIFIVVMLIMNTKVNAASANIKCDSTATVGTPVKITVSGTGVQWNLTLKANGSTIGSSRELDNYESNKNISFSGTYTPTSTEPIKVTLEGTVTEFSDGSTIRSFTSKEIKVNPKPTTPPTEGNSGGNSSNGGSSTTQTKATIKKLVVAGKTYNNPSKNITVKVDNDVTNAKISVTTSNGESFKINKGDNVKLEEGTNTVKITLASGNVYTVNIRRAAKEDDTPNIIDEQKPEEKVLLKSLKLQGVNIDEEKVELSYSPEFSSEVYEYSVNVANDITKIDVEALANNENYLVEITGNEELKDGENIITILVKAKDSDKVTTYQIKVIKEKAIEAVATLDETPQTGEENGINNNIIKIVIVTFTAIVAIAGIIFAVIEYNYSKKHPKEEMEGIPYSEIGFKDEETDKEDILEEPDYYIDEDEDIKEKKKRKKGKHF